MNSSRALPLSRRFFESEFYLTHIGREEVAPRQPYPELKHPGYYGFKAKEGRILGEFCLNLIIRGGGELHTRLGKQVIRAGQVILCKPGEWHCYRPDPSTGWTNLWINFNGTLPREWLKSGAFCLEKNVVKVINQDAFSQLLNDLVDSVCADQENVSGYYAKAMECFTHIVAGTPPERPLSVNIETNTDPIVNRVMDYIWNNNETVIGVAQISEHTSINRRTLERHFSSCFGNTPLSEIHWCCLSRAALLLCETDARIKYIVERSGFGGYQRLRQAFQKYFGVSPKEFRNYIRNSYASPYQVSKAA